MKQKSVDLPGPLAPLAPPSKELLAILESALPTRTRAQGALDGKRDWAAFAQRLSAMTPPSPTAKWVFNPEHSPVRKLLTSRKSAYEWLRERASSNQEQNLSGLEALEWIKNLRSLLFQAVDRLEFYGPFMAWLVTQWEPEQFVEMALGLFKWESSIRLDYFDDICDVHLALRAALVKTSESFYDQTLALFAQIQEEKPSKRLALRAWLAFILADDRPQMHALQPLSVLNDAQKAGEMPFAEPFMSLRLIIDSPPSEMAWWRAQKGEDLKWEFAHLSRDRVGPTLVAVAREQRLSALPSLKWLMPSLWHELSALVIDLDEPLAFSLLLPYLGEKRVAAALDKAAAARPGALFVKCLGAVLSGCADPLMLTRVREMIRGAPEEALRQWVGADAKALEYIHQTLQANTVPLASLDALPKVLREPPWLVKAQPRQDPVLTVEPLPTPFNYIPLPPLNDPAWDLGDEYWGKDLDIFVKYILITLNKLSPGKGEESNFRGPQWGKLATFDSDLQALLHDSAKCDEFFKDVDPAQGALAFLLAHNFPWFSPRHLCKDFLFDLAIARLGDRALGAFLKFHAIYPGRVWGYVSRFDAPEVATLVADGFWRIKNVRDLSSEWLLKFRRTAFMRLIPDAVGAHGPRRQAALHALRWLADANRGEGKTGGAAGREELAQVAALYARTCPDLPRALMAAMEGDPLALYPRAIPKLPAWLSLHALTRPKLRAGGALPDGAITALVQMLSFSTQDAVYAGIEQVKGALTHESLALFAWDLFSLWLSHGAPSKDSWAMWALSWIGGEEAATKLTRLILTWPALKASARALEGVAVLENIGSEAALAGLGRIAFKGKDKALGQDAHKKIAAIAQARDLTLEEMAERLVPDLDLDDKGEMDLIYGERRFRIGLDEFLTPFVKDASGKRLKAVPRPNASDDPVLAREALAQWKTFKEDLKELAAAQIKRLEKMLVSSRRIAPAAFLQYYVKHPLMRRLACRLLWGIYPGDDPASGPQVTFRVCEDLSAAGLIDGVIDEPFDLMSSGHAQGLAGLVHPLELTAESLQAWGTLFADYAISQPFAQLARETYALTEQERQSSVITRFEGQWADPGRIYGAAAQGWKVVSIEGEYIESIHKEIMLGGAMACVKLAFARGSLAPGRGESAAVALGKLTIESEGGGAGAEKELHFGLLSALEASEVLRAPSLLAAKGTKETKGT